MRKVAMIVCTLFLALLARAQDDVDPERWLTRSGFYLVSYQSELEPLEINRIHAWIIRVRNADGEPVEGALVSITGGMPLHNHGLPTTPKMTQALGDGAYRIEGMRFHMHGYWELTVTVDVDGRRDTVVLPLTI